MQRGDTYLVVLVLLCVAVLGQLTTSADKAPELSLDHDGPGPSTGSLEPEETDHTDSLIKDSDRTDEQVQQLESSLLNMFGLSKRPRPRGKIQIPQHMIELYKIQAGITGDLDIEMNRQPVKRYPGNTIRSFYSEDEYSHTSKRTKREAIDTPQNTEEHHIVRLFFNVSHLPDHETIKGAELRLFRRKANDSFQNLQSNQEYLEMHSSINKAHRIDIYEIIKPSTPTQESITRLIDTRFLKDLSKSKWETFDIHPAVHRWRNSPKSNFGLEVHFTDMKRNKPHLKHVRLRRSTDNSLDSEWNSEQPLLITYSDDGKGETPRRKRRAVEDDEDNVVEEEVNVAEMTDDERRAYNREQRKKKRKKEAGRKKNRRSKQCQRRPLYVDFKDVGWSDWIIAPPGYDAYFCLGECPFYLPDHMNATNHAIVQTLVHSVNRQAAPPPCCVPTELSDIAMLFIDENEKVVLRNYQDMTVMACGCR